MTNFIAVDYASVFCPQKRLINMNVLCIISKIVIN